MALDLSIVVKASTEQAQRDIQRLAARVDDFGQVSLRSGQVTASGFSAASRGVQSISQQLATAKAQLLGFVGVYQGIAALRAVTDVVTEFERLNAQLKTLTGSQAAAKTAFDAIQKFALDTPYQLTEVTNTWVMLKARGIDPTNAAMTGLGNVAAAMGRDILDVTNTALQASVGNLETMRVMGFAVEAQGSKLKITFNGITREVEKSAAGLITYFEEIGNTQFSGAMADQMDVLGGALSNVVDNTQKAVFALSGSSGLTGAMTDAANATAAWLGELDAAAAVDALALASGALATVLAVRLAPAVWEYTKAEAARASAMLAQRTASAAAMQQAIASAQAEVVRTDALLDEARAEQAAALATNLRGAALTNINVRVQQATAAQTAATAALGAAQAQAAARAGMLATVGRGLLGVVGGIPGLIAGGVTALGLWALSSRDAADASGSLHEKLQQLAGDFDDIRGQEIEAAIAEAEREIARLDAVAASFAGQIARGTVTAADQLMWFNGQIDAAQDEAAQYRAEIARLRGELEKLGRGTKPPAPAEAADLSAVEKYLAALREQISLVGASEAALAQHRAAQEMEEMAAKAAADGNDALAAAYRAAIPQAQQLAAQLKAKEAATKAAAKATEDAKARTDELTTAWEVEWDAILKAGAAYDGALSAMKDEIALLGLSARERFAEIKVREAQARAQQANINLNGDEVAALRAQARALYDAQASAQEYGKQADPFAEAWVHAIERMDASWADMWADFMESGRMSMDAIKQAFLRMLAEMIHAGTTRKIMLSFGLGGSGTAMAGPGGAGGMDMTGMFMNGSGGGSSLNAMSNAMGFSNPAWMGAAAGGIGGAFYGYEKDRWRGASIYGLGGYVGGAALTGALTTGGSMLGGAMAGGAAALGAIPGWGWALLGAAALFGGGRKPAAPHGALASGSAATAAGDITTASGAFGNIGFASGAHHVGGEEKTPAAMSYFQALADLDNALASTMTRAEVDRISAALDGWTSTSTRAFDDFEAMAEERLAVILNEVGAGMGDLLAGFDGSLEETSAYALALVTNLNTVNHGMDALGLALLSVDAAGATAASALVDLFGGLESFTGALDYYYQNFYTAEERRAAVLDTATMQIADFNAALGLSGEAYVDTKEELRALVDGLDLTSESGQQMFLELMRIAPAINDLVSAEEDLAAAREDSAAATEGALSQSASAIHAFYRDFVATTAGEFGQLAASFRDLSGSLREYYDTLIEGSSAISDTTKLNSAFGTFVDVYRRAVSGSLEATAAMQGATEGYVSALERYATSTEEYALGRARASAAVLQVSQVASQRSVHYQAEYERLKVVDGLLSDYENIGPIGYVPYPYTDMPYYADGGTHAGGWRVVGERGPELEYTGPSAILSHDRSRALFDDSGIRAELRGLRQELAALNRHSSSTAKQLQRWEFGGMPGVRTEVMA